MWDTEPLIALIDAQLAQSGADFVTSMAQPAGPFGAVVFGAIDDHAVRLEFFIEPATNMCAVNLFDMTTKKVFVERAGADFCEGHRRLSPGRADRNAWCDLITRRKPTQGLVPQRRSLEEAFSPLDLLRLLRCQGELWPVSLCGAGVRSERFRVLPRRAAQPVRLRSVGRRSAQGVVCHESGVPEIDGQGAMRALAP